MSTAPAFVPEPDLVVVEGLSRYFALDKRSKQIVRAVDDVSFTIRRGETFGLVGESGSGKSTLARLLLRLDRATAGRILFDGIDIASLSASELRKLRWRMQMVFQDPFASLNRRRTVEQTIEMPLRVHQPQLRSRERAVRVRELLDLVGLRASHALAYPRELSGGQCQRVSIARALSIRPEFVVLDEAVSAVDVSIQAQILNLLRELQDRLRLTYLFVSHDLSVVRYMSNTIGVMYGGKIVELATREQLFTSPRHPYTHGLLASVAVPDLEVGHPSAHQLVREGIDVGSEVLGCRFHPRCPLGTRELCRELEPPLELVGPEHYAACHFPQSAESLAREVAVEGLSSSSAEA